MLFVPVRKKASTSTIEISFQRPLVPTSTDAPLIFNSTRLAPRTPNCAVLGRLANVNSRRKVASRLPMGCNLASTADGKRTHSARRSRGRKLIFGSRTHSNASHARAVAPNVKIRATRCQVFKKGASLRDLTANVEPRQVRQKNGLVRGRACDGLSDCVPWSREKADSSPAAIAPLGCFTQSGPGDQSHGTRLRFAAVRQRKDREETADREYARRISIFARRNRRRGGPRL